MKNKKKSNDLNHLDEIDQTLVAALKKNHHLPAQTIEEYKELEMQVKNEKCQLPDNFKETLKIISEGGNKKQTKSLSQKVKSKMIVDDVLVAKFR